MGALSIYIIHLAIIGYIIKPMLVSINSMDIFTLVFVAHVTALLIITSLFQKFKNTYTKLPTVVYWLIGK